MSATTLDIVRRAINLGRKRLYEAQLREQEQFEVERAAAKRPSRPAVPSRGLWFRIKETDKELLIRAADAAGAGNLSGWAKKVLLDAARQLLDSPAMEGPSPRTGS
jgi:hypothetical protein